MRACAAANAGLDGDGYEVRKSVNKTRARASIITVTADAMRETLEAPKLTATERLAASRARIRDYLEERAAPRRRRAQRAQQAQHVGQRLSSKAGEWVDRLKGHPIAGVVIEAVA